MDEFRLIGHGDHLRAFTLSTPGISPIFGQNPGFHVYDFAESGRLLDRATWFLSNLADAGSPLQWQLEYVFSKAWDLPGLDLPGLARLGHDIRSVPRARATWFSIYRVGRPSIWHVPGGVESLPSKVFDAYNCAIAHVDPDEYRDCACGR